MYLLGRERAILRILNIIISIILIEYSRYFAIFEFDN